MQKPILHPIEIMNVEEITELIKTNEKWGKFRTEEGFQKMILEKRPMELILWGKVVLSDSGHKKPVQELVRRVIDRVYNCSRDRRKAEKAEKARKKASLKNPESAE